MLHHHLKFLLNLLLLIHPIIILHLNPNPTPSLSLVLVLIILVHSLNLNLMLNLLSLFQSYRPLSQLLYNIILICIDQCQLQLLLLLKFLLLERLQPLVNAVV